MLLFQMHSAASVQCCYSRCTLQPREVPGVCVAEQGKDTSSLAQLNGTWRLIYSSAFAKGNAPALPGYKLGQVKRRLRSSATETAGLSAVFNACC